MDIKPHSLAATSLKFTFCLPSIKRIKYNPYLFFKLVILMAILGFCVKQYYQAENIDNTSLSYIKAPKINDIYFLDFRLMSNELRPKEKYRLAKVVDITGDIITLQYGSIYYFRQQSLKDSIRYGQLRYRKYFESKRYDFSLDNINSLWHSGAIYLVKRPELDKLFGNNVSPDKTALNNHLFTPGKRENLSGISFLKSNYIENNLQQAFELFQQSAQLGFAKGQVNLAQMYLNGQYVEKNLSQALFWFKQASLQSNKSGILKYAIVCEQVESCDLPAFYQSLLAAGVNIKVREMKLKLPSSTSLNGR